MRPEAISKILIFPLTFSKTVKNRDSENADIINGIPIPREKTPKSTAPLTAVAFAPAMVKIAAKNGVAQAVKLKANTLPMKNTPKKPAGLDFGIKFFAAIKNFSLF